MIHHYQKGTNDVVIVALHGTGGNEHDLLPLVTHIMPQAHILSLRGRILERGMPRFFKRLSPGVFDELNIVEETLHILNTLEHLKTTYELQNHKWWLLGYSNGANIATSMLWHAPQSFLGATLFHPMMPFKQFHLPSLEGINIFIGAGKNDPMVTQEETLQLAQTYLEHQANVETFWVTSGHTLSPLEVSEARRHLLQIL
jgi:phospholipase/carboxylesterase